MLHGLAHWCDFSYLHQRSSTKVCCKLRRNLRLLEAAGAELVPFSPLSGALPERCAGLYIGGGCPERHARALAAQRPLMAAVRAFAGAGGVIYGEGGGLVFLSQSLQPHGELPAAMGALPAAKYTSRVLLACEDRHRPRLC